jgi:CheY-like chemotaxis protein
MKTLLCADFGFYDEIYSKIPEQNPNVVMDYVEDGETALEYLSKKRYDYLITTIVMPKKHGFDVIDEIREEPDKYSSPKITILTGLCGDTFLEEVKKRKVNFISRYERNIEDILFDISKFLNK